jgi:predicted metal-dependent hydrolase
MNLSFHVLLGNIVEVYIDDIVVKLAEFSSHIANLRKAFDKMCQYGLKMNPRKCSFGLSAGKFLGFIIHEHGIEIDPDRIKSIQNVGPLTCKVEVQKFLSKVNYLQRFISNLARKIDAFTPILRLKNDVKSTWGQNNRKHLISSENICLRLSY